MNDLLQRIADDVSDLKTAAARQEATLAGQAATLAGQSASLGEHMRRTEAAEKNLEMLRADFAPVQRHVDRVEFLLKVFVAAAGIVTFVGGVLAVITYIKQLVQ